MLKKCCCAFGVILAGEGVSLCNSTVMRELAQLHEMRRR